MEFDNLVKKRHSVRDFADKKTSWKLVLDAIDSTLACPYADNQNNLKFIIIEKPETIKEISKLSEQSWIEDASIVVVVCSDNRHLEKMYGDRGKIYSRQQAGAAIQTLLLKLTDLGLGACWIGAYPDEILEQTLKIPSFMRIEAIIPIGHEKPVKGKPEKIKLSLEHVIRWEDFSQERRPTLFEEHKGGLD